MGILIDSDIVIDFLNNQRFAVIFFKDTASKKEIFISIITWIEVAYGFNKNKSVNKIEIFRDFLEDYRVTFIFIDENVAKKFLDVKIDLENRRVPLSDFDLFIASTALAYNLSLVTRNIKHFKRIKDLNLL